MRALLPLAVLAMAACDPPLEELYPPRFYAFDRDGITYDVRAQYDPFARKWFTRVMSIERPLDADDGAFATALVEQDLGPQLCGGDYLAVQPGEVWNPLAGDRVEFLEDLGAWHLVGACSDIPAPPAAVAVVPGETPVAAIIDN